MTEDDDLYRQIREYLEANRANYTMPALRARLVSDGVPPEAVDRVIAEMSTVPYYGATPAPAVDEKPWGVGRFFLVCAASVVVNVGVIVGLFALMIWANSGWIFALGSFLAIAVEVYLAVRYAKQSSAVTAGILVAIVVTPVVVGVLLVGACFAMIAGGGRIAG